MGSATAATYRTPAHLAREFLIEPASRTDFTAYRRLLTEAPLLDVGGMWIASGHAEVNRLAADPRLVIDPRAADPPLPLTQSERLEQLFSRMLNFRDGDPHARLRRLVTTAFSARRVARIQPVVESVVAGLLDDAAARGGFDAVADLGVPLPVAVSCAMLDLPRAVWSQITAWAQVFTAQLFAFEQSPEQLADVERQLDELTAYVDELAAERRGRPGDLIAELLHASEEHERLTRDEFVAFVVLLFMNGLETVTAAVTAAVAALLWRPGLVERLRAEPGCAAAVFAEVLRLDSPLWLGARRAAADIAVDGHRIRRSAPVFLLWAVANRDPRAFAEPDEFRPGRPGRHVAFGHGAHHCLGAPLAVAQGATVLRTLAARCDLDSPVTGPDAVRRRYTMALSGYADLPVTVTARTVRDV
jgi:cytochrome P450